MSPIKRKRRSSAHSSPSKRSAVASSSRLPVRRTPPGTVAFSELPPLRAEATVPPAVVVPHETTALLQRYFKLMMWVLTARHISDKITWWLLYTPAYGFAPPLISDQREGVSILEAAGTLVNALMRHLSPGSGVIFEPPPLPRSTGVSALQKYVLHDTPVHVVKASMGDVDIGQAQLDLLVSTHRKRILGATPTPTW